MSAAAPCAGDRHPPERKAVTTALVAITAALVAAGIIWWTLRDERVTPPPQVRFEIETPASLALNLTTTTPTLAMSADGRRLAYVDNRMIGSGGALVVRGIDDLVPRQVEGVARAREPFFSPDGQWLGYQGDLGLERVPVTGGASQVVVSTKGPVRGAAWLDDGTIVFATTDPASGLLRVAEAGGTPTVLTTPNRDAGEADHLFPAALPAGRGVLFTVVSASTGDASVAVLDLRSQTTKVVLPSAACARYASSGHLVYASARALLAVPFDLQSLEVTGEPVTLVNRVLMGTAGCAYFATSATGALSYVPLSAGDGPPRSLVWVDRQGAEFPGTWRLRGRTRTCGCHQTGRCWPCRLRRTTETCGRRTSRGRRSRA